MKLNQEFKEFVELLNCHKVEYLVVGGYAVGFYGHPRYTGAIDIWVLPAKTNSEKLMKVLRDFGFGSLNLDAATFQENDTVVQFGYEPNRIDILTSV